MLMNYFKIAVRNLWRNKSFSAINIMGLAVGLATCLLITLYVKDELSYDRYHEKADRIYRINADFLVNGNTFKERTVPAKLGVVLVKDYPEVEKYVRTFENGNGSILVKKDNQTLLEHNAIYADSTLFDVFTLPMVSGDAKTALTEPHSIVISESMAKKYFNTTDVVGKSLITDNINTYKVTGVIKDMPAQSHVHYDFIKAMSELEGSRNSTWMEDAYETYILVRPGTPASAINNDLRAATRQYMDAELKHMVGSSIDEIEKKGGYFRYTILPVADIHLHSTITNEAEPAGNIQYVYIFIAVAVFILLIACVNFMNLSTARSSGRSREVGVRKVLGSRRSELIFQFLTESVLTSFISLAVGIMIVLILLPYLNQLSGKSIRIDLFSSFWLLPSLLITALVVGLMAGSYPAFFLSAFEPVQVLKGKLAAGFKGGWLRNSLVVFQFATAIILIIGTLVIYSQLQYIRNKDIGYNREQVLELKNTASLWNHAKTFKDEVLQIPGVTAGTMTNSLPTSGIMNTNIYSKDAARSAGQVTGIGEWFIDADYIPTMDMKMVKGRNFSPLMPTDTMAIIINESAAHVLDFKEPIDKNLYADGHVLKIIGVVQDFNAGSLRNKIPPLILRLGESRDIMAFRIRAKDASSIISHIEKKYHAVDKMAGQPFLYSFMNESFDKLYQSEQRTGKIFISFAVFAILIACLGLFGLVTYAAEQRTKEIGIRKVLGASVGNIAGMLSKDFVKLVLIAAVIAFPVAWWGMSKWLQDFAYRTSISAWVFVIAGVSAIAITLLTVSFRAVSAALANPVDSLKNE